MSLSPIVAFVMLFTFAGTVHAQSSAAPTNQSAEEIVIKEKLKVAGVSGLKDLKRNRDGSWDGRGMKDQTEVAVVVDTEGNIIFH